VQCFSTNSESADLSVSHNKIGDVEVAQGDLAGALNSYRAGFAIRERLAQSDPTNSIWQHDLSFSYGRLSTALQKAAQLAEAREAAIAGRAIVVSLVERFPESAQLKQDLAWFDGQIAALPG
jgi:hypothetical protein